MNELLLTNVIKKKIDDLCNKFKDSKDALKILNDYIDEVGEIPQWEDVDVEDEKIKKLIASAIDYGYYYVREEGNGVKVINLKDADDVDKLIGTLDRAIVKYPGNGVKSTYARVYLKDSEQGLKYVEVQIRNAAGGIGRPSIKIQTK